MNDYYAHLNVGCGIELQHSKKDTFHSSELATPYSLETTHIWHGEVEDIEEGVLVASLYDQTENKYSSLEYPLEEIPDEIRDSLVPGVYFYLIKGFLYRDNINTGKEVVRFRLKRRVGVPLSSQRLDELLERYDISDSFRDSPSYID